MPDNEYIGRRKGRSGEAGQPATLTTEYLTFDTGRVGKEGSNMTAKTMHIGFDVQGFIRLLEDIPYKKRDMKWAEARTEFEKFKKQGLKNVSSCPTPIEESPGVWVCPGHPIK